MPYPFVLPTTSSFVFSTSFTCESHPSLPLNATTYRGVVRDALKKHKRLPPASRGSDLPNVISSLTNYLPYVLAIDAGVRNQSFGDESIRATMTAPPSIEWRPTLSGELVPGKERNRVKISSLEEEIAFVVSSLAIAHIGTARSLLQPLYTTTEAFVGTQERTVAITTATKHLLTGASLYDYLSSRGEQSTSSNVDVAQSTIRAMSCLALAEATLLAILKDDPYPAVVSQDRNKEDREWMYKAPEIPKVRAHLYARLALASSEHAGKAASLFQSGGSGTNKINSGIVKYANDLRSSSKAKACRFFGIDAELGGQTADGIGWLRAGLRELGVEVQEAKKGLSFSRFKKEFTEKREDKRIAKDAAWGADAGRLEETRVLEMLDAKWTKMNDTVGWTGTVWVNICANFLLDEHASDSGSEHAPNQDALGP